MIVGSEEGGGGELTCERVGSSEEMIVGSEGGGELTCERVGSSEEMIVGSEGGGGS